AAPRRAEEADGRSTCTRHARTRAGPSRRGCGTARRPDRPRPRRGTLPPRGAGRGRSSRTRRAPPRRGPSRLRRRARTPPTHPAAALPRSASRRRLPLESLARERALSLEQLALALEAPAVAGERAVPAQGTVTRDRDPDRVRAAGGADGPRRARSADSRRQRGV